ncbi:hypothetical protein B0H17DRAFT_1244242 [Mycena rosella]|uniref:NAD-dependent epimerase/dehydratase domain-containing protein n=1 Tax=Mycena rosella TaxID=1033263 RepID=A0AAD7DXN3_MYCRO|nr:hypothetical protein B0H17DRAFT_1244242 [Mycena rosella]
MSAEPKPLVTGAVGFVGFEIVYQLLEAGYAVRGYISVCGLEGKLTFLSRAARGRKPSLLKKALEKYPQFAAVEITDVAMSDLTAALKGVGAVIHTAAPLAGRADSKTAHTAGIKKFIATGSIISFPDNAYGPNGSWPTYIYTTASNYGRKIGSRSLKVVGANGLIAYIAQKKLGEQAILEFADAHPEMDITILCPSWIFGPLTPGFEHIVPEPDFTTLPSNGYIYQLLRSDNVNYHCQPSGVMDIRDVARIHIAGLNPLTRDHARRVPLSSPYPGAFRDAINYISEARPELRARLADPSTVPFWPAYKLNVDLAPVEKAFGIPLGSYKMWKETILDAVDSLVGLEKQWKSKGLAVEVPTEPPVEM